MNIWLRRIFFIFTIIVFFIIAPLLLFYSMGWRYNFETKQLEKVGVITIQTEPRSASVVFNDKLLNKKTPLTIKNLLSDEYNLSIYKDGYYQWSKDVKVNQSETTPVPLIYLLKAQSSLKPIIQQPLKIITQSPDRKKIAVSRNNSVEITELDNFKTIHTNLVDNEVLDFFWSLNSDKIICSLENGSFTLIDTNSATNVLTLFELFNVQPSAIQWSQDENDIIYASANNSDFYRLNTFQKTATLLFSNKNIIFTTNELFFDQRGDTLVALNNDGKQINSLNLKKNAELSFLTTLDGYLPIIDNNNEIAYFYNIDDNDFEKLSETVKNIYWNKGENKLLFHNNHEIWSWDHDKDEKELIIRTSETITDAVWMAKSSYVIYSQKDNGLKIIEATGSQKNNYDINLENITELFQDNGSIKIYVFSNQLLYELEF